MLTLAAASEQIRTRKLSPVELTRECLARIEQLNPRLNAFIAVTADLAMRQALTAEDEVMAGNWRGPLHGIPIALKDLIDTVGVPTTAASNQFRDRIPAADSELFTQLKRAGAVLVGKTNLHEFAYGGSGVVSAFGPARNPWNTERITGGSSSGSAAAVAAGLCIAAFGTDTGGSIRCPAALCGIVGHRPSSGLLSLQGVIPLSTTFDTLGPMTRTVRDAAILLDATAAPPEHDEDYESALGREVSRYVLGLPRSKFCEGLEPDVGSAVDEALTVLQTIVSDIREVDLPPAKRGDVFNAEVYEYHQAMVANSPEKYQPHTLARLRTCAGVTATQYIRDLRSLAQERAQAAKLFEKINVVVTPAVPIAAPRLLDLEALGPDELRQFEMSYLIRNNAPFSALRWPSLSVPCGFTQEGLPVGLQLSAPDGGDVTILRLAHAYEQATAWQKRIPKV
jgi:aspartyl-tRNA(Asn)/glutamyl-tRNA(Gln) amidotransferase subunit A